ncbi:hypothetical protein RJ639_030244 [Escallonia herrerae]|uniref:3-dehydroquinate synthase N-terminal domain-containing protein n=1 Tax=Escallonia herrerae TaxID=1293975 RepID=A0AA89BCD5_9ASTE|nr:hypothetical protein RJ639_030244 [Escallonia herrerae]
MDLEEVVASADLDMVALVGGDPAPLVGLVDPEASDAGFLGFESTAVLPLVTLTSTETHFAVPLLVPAPMEVPAMEYAAVTTTVSSSSSASSSSSSRKRDRQAQELIGEADLDSKRPKLVPSVDNPQPPGKWKNCGNNSSRVKMGMTTSSSDSSMSKKLVWIWTENKQVMTAAVERGWNTFIFSSHHRHLAIDWSFYPF